MDLPVVQQRLLKAMHATGKPVIFISCSGSAIGFGAVKDEYNALLQAWYGGQGGAQAIADVVFGDYNPYTTYVYGDWYFAPKVRHTGAVFLNDLMM